LKTVLLDLIAKWRGKDAEVTWYTGEADILRGCADELEAALTPFVQELGAKIIEQSEAARIHGQYEVCTALHTAIETMENALLGPENKS
jgi:hypothetical protein